MSSLAGQNVGIVLLLRALFVKVTISNILAGYKKKQLHIGNQWMEIAICLYVFPFYASYTGICTFCGLLLRLMWIYNANCIIKGKATLNINVKFSYCFSLG